MDSEKLLKDEELKAIVRQAADFLNPVDPRARSYRAEINVMMTRGGKRVTVGLTFCMTGCAELAVGQH
jgi:DNA replication licensing factor MCM3